jgi:hypothetical protein
MEGKGFDYRTFYTWDHSTNWDLTQPGQRVSGCHELYEKPPEAFTEDYKRLIDFMNRLGLNHLIIWGALRDCHGGAAKLRELVSYGRRQNVRVAPGMGVNCYGGLFYEGDHEFSLVRLLQKHPEMAAHDKDGKPKINPKNPRRSAACPRHPRMMAWNLAALRWLMEEVGPEAIHFETGDYGICRCKRCRSSGDRSHFTSIDDMAEVLPPLVSEVRKYSRDCWLSYNHYTGYTRDMTEHPPLFVSRIPQDVICKWGVSWMLAPEYRKNAGSASVRFEPMQAGIGPPTHTSMAHIHYATGWWNCSPRGTLEISRFFRAIPMIRNVGFQGICTHGEDSCLVPASELNYHVFAALAENPAAEPEEIAKRSVGALFGCEDLAAEVLTAYRERRVPAGLPPRVARAAEAAMGQHKVRLTWLIFELHRFADQMRGTR